MQFLPVLPQHVHRHGPENPEVDRYGRRGEPGTWSAIGLKQSSYRLTRDELRVRPAGKSTGQHLWVKQKMPIRGACEGNGMGSTAWTVLLKPSLNYGMMIGPSYSTLVPVKWSIAKLALGQFVLLPMQGWNWPIFEMFRIPGTSHHTRITAMNVCDSRFDRLWHGAKSFHSLSKCQCSTSSWPLVSFSYFNARMKVTCFGDVWNTGHMLVTSPNHSDERLWQPFRQTLAWCQVVSQPFFLSASRMGSPLSGTLAELAPHVGVKAASNMA